MKPKLTIVRGLPGSGKTTFARDLAERTGALLVEPDSLLICGGVYNYTLVRWRDAVEASYKIMQAVAFMGGDMIYSDVLPTRLDAREVISSFSTWACGDVEVAVIDMPHLTVDEDLARNRHNVRREDIERMAASWEPWG